MVSRVVAVFVAGWLAWPASGVAAVPFVGCPADGQTGPVAAPHRPRTLPDAPEGLAFYGSGDLGVLAPLGWHCVGLYGSDGSILFVTPEPHTADSLMQDDTPLHGPAIQLTLSIGDTSGRFAVARLAARLFPAKRAFVQQVIAEDVDPASDFPFGPYPTDTVTLHGPTLAEFTTPAGLKGLGTDSRLAPDAAPIDGLALMTADNDAVVLAVRLPAKLHGLAPAIVAAARNPATRRGGR